MKFRTQIPVTPGVNRIDYTSEILTLGSCFAEHIGKRLDYFQFNNTTNPFGILFQPRAIENMLRVVSANKKFTANDLFFHHERWHSFQLHSMWSHTDKQQLLAGINDMITTLHQKLPSVTHCLFTLGTAWEYRLLDTDVPVANCHKIPTNRFRKVLLYSAEIQDSLERSIRILRAINPDINIVFTVSPVRHIKDGFVENQVSKAQLISAVYAMKQQGEGYFPSYEIMMDELRDYRFYEADMLHPNTTAIAYIWQRFAESHIAGEARVYMNEIDHIQKALAHRPFNAQSREHKEFLSQLNERINKLRKALPFIRF